MIERVRQKLQGKRVLFISAKFYHYSEAVYEKIKSYGAQVAFYHERDTSLKHVAIANLFPKRMENYLDSHYRKILDEISNQSFDYFIIIRGYKMPIWFMQAVKEKNPHIYTIMYQWDLYGLWDADYRYLMPYFHRTLSFDFKDSAALNIPYAPTFHMDEYSGIKSSGFSFDFIYCTNHTDEKYAFFKSFMALSKQRGYKVYAHLYLSWFKYLKERLRGNKICLKDVSFRRLNRKQYFELFCKSKAVVDFSGSMQTGLSMRVIDALGSGKRVLTNNASATQEPGFNPRQIVIYDPTNLSLPDFVSDVEDFEKRDYSIDKWLDNLFYAS